MNSKMYCLANCGKELKGTHLGNKDAYSFDCPVCGEYKVTASLEAQQAKAPVHYAQDGFKTLIGGPYKDKIIHTSDLMKSDFQVIKV